MAIQIDSVTNEKIKYLAKIATSSRFRKDNREFFLEGLRLCVDAAVTDVQISAVYYTQKAYDKSAAEIEQIKAKAENSYLISQTVCAKISQTESSQGVFCRCRFLPEANESDIDTAKKYIALDNVQNPDNLGAVARTAEALGISGIIVSGGCDIYNPKAQRAAMGSLLRLPVIKAEELSVLLENLSSKMKIYATTPDSTALEITRADMSGGVICVIGNEANGISDEVFSHCRKITIPMLGRAESLNAAMAAAVTMWEMMR